MDSRRNKKLVHVSSPHWTETKFGQKNATRLVNWTERFNSNWLESATGFNVYLLLLLLSIYYYYQKQTLS